MNTFLTILLAVIGSSGVASVVVACLQRHWQKKDKGDARIDALVTAQQVMMIDRVRSMGKDCLQDGFISISDKETLAEMYGAYKALGGNGHLETIMSEIDRLEVRG